MRELPTQEDEKSFTYFDALVYVANDM